MKTAFIICFVALCFLVTVNYGASQRNDGKAAIRRRPIRAGDYFMTQDMLPVAQRLYDKLEKHGEGQGIVSSSLSPERLAEKLFMSTFLTDSQLVVLNQIDIPILDAFQALALSDPVKNENFTEFIDSRLDNSSGLIATPARHESSVRTSFFTLMSKEDTDTLENTEATLHQDHFANQTGVTNEQINVTLGHNCRWRYHCSPPTDLDRCMLYEYCLPERRFLTPKELKSNAILRNFRKMMSITLLDEQVERILEIRVLTLMKHQRSFLKLVPVESIKEYFDNVKNRQKERLPETLKHRMTTKSMGHHE